jgi:hypothetical protein
MEAPGVVDLLGQPWRQPTQLNCAPTTSAVVAMSSVKATTAEVMSPIAANTSAAREPASGHSDLPRLVANLT